MAKIQLKRLTSGTIENSAVVLADGEPCLAKDSEGKQYIVFGDGSTPIKDLTWEPLGDAASVKIDDLTIVKNASDELEVQLSEEDGNAIEVKTDGLFVETLDQVKVSTKANLPTTGEEDTLYVVEDEKHIYYWNGTAYVQLTQDLAGLNYKGSKDKTADLPTSGNENGDFWWIVEEDKFKIYNGTGWDTINLPANVQPDMAETTTTSMTFIKNKDAQYVAYAPKTDGVIPATAKTVKAALDSLDDTTKTKQDKVSTAKENNYASWDNAGQTKDSGDSKTTTVATFDAASDNKLPSEKAVAKKFQEIEDTLNSQATGNAGDQGDKAILPLMTTATGWYNLRPTRKSGETNFLDRRSGGYAFTGPQHQYLNKTFNRLKLMIASPGWVRIGIIRGTGTNEFDGVARGFCRGGVDYEDTDVYPASLVDGAEDTTADGTPKKMLKKWLVAQWIATPGVHEFDIADEIITSPFEYLFVECRQGVSGWALNRNATDATVDGLTIPAGTSVNATSYPTSFVSTTNFNNGSYCVSNNMLDASARPTYSTSEGSNGVIYGSWMDVSASEFLNPRAVSRGETTSWLNLGVYLRGSSGNTYLDPVIENSIVNSNLSGLGTDNAIKAYGPDYDMQQILAKKGSRIYGIEMVVTVPGDFTLYVFSSNDPATARIVNCFTLRVRAIGRQLIHLPEEIILQPGQWIGFNGATEAVFRGSPTAAQVGTATAFNKGYVDTCKFAHGLPVVSNWTAFGDDTTGVQDILPYSSAVGEKSLKKFCMWGGVKYDTTTGKFDFTEATFNPSVNEYLNVSLVVRGGNRSKMEDWNYSVTGDSISTYAGQISQSTDFGVTVNAAGNNAVFYPNGGSGLTNSIDGTWWGILGKQTRMRLIKNDAWSGSQVGGTDSTTNSTACASNIRTGMLHGGSVNYAANTGTGLGTNFGTPDVIFTMIGTNDLAGNRATGAWSNTMPADISTILGAFETMVIRHKQKYPSAKLVYFLIPRGTTMPLPYVNGNAMSISQLADSFEYIAKNIGAFFVPLPYFSKLNTQNIPMWTVTSGYTTPRTATYASFATDNLHPSTIGHQQIADGLQRFCEEKF